MLQIVCSSVRVKLLARAKLIFLREQPHAFFSVGNPALGEDLWWPFKISVKSHAHFQMVDNVIVQCELLLTSIFQFLCPQKNRKFIHGGHFEFQ